MKIKRLVVLCLSFVLILTSGAFAKGNMNQMVSDVKIQLNNDKQIEGRVDDFISDHVNLNYKIVADDVSQEVQAWVRDNIENKRNAVIKKIGGKNYAFVMQQAPNPAYKIDVRNVFSIDNTLIVNYEINRIDGNPTVIQIITYPYVVIEIDNNVDYSNIVARKNDALTDDSINIRHNVNFSIVDKENSPIEIQEWIDQNKENRIMNSVKKYNGKSYVFLMDEVPTSGYSIVVNNIFSIGHNLFIQYGAELTAKGDMVLQVISYPYLVLEVESNKDFVPYIYSNSMKSVNKK